MADGTKIEWADATVNAINGCSVVSPGCTNCYAMRLAGTRLRNHPSREGLTVLSKAGPVWNGTVKLSESALMQPLRWRRPRVIFWNAHGDTFHDAVPDAWIDRMFAVMALTPQHMHLVLTKRSARMRAYFAADDARKKGIRAAYDSMGYSEVWLPEWPLPNVWLGVSVEDQARADERIPDLLATPAAGRFLSCEPLLGPVDLTSIDHERDRGWEESMDALRGLTSEELTAEWGEYMPARPALDGVIVGGESGPGARPMHPDWARSVRDQCAAAGVDFHFKQWGEWHPHDSDCGLYSGPASKSPHGFRTAFVGKGPSDRLMIQVGKKAAGRLLDGVTHDVLPWRVSTSLDTNGG